MLGLAWSEASRSEEVARKLEQTGRRRKRKPKKAATSTPKTSEREKYHVDKHSCFALQSSLNPRRLVVVNWNKHPVLDIKVTEGGEPFEDKDTPEANSGVSDTSNRPTCETFCCLSVEEATEKLQDRLLNRVDREKLVIVGHGVERILYEWNIPPRMVNWSNQRCTATYPPYMEEQSDALSKLLLPSELDDLMKRILKRRPSNNLWHQAAAALDLYRKAQQFWERDLEKLKSKKEKPGPTKKVEAPPTFIPSAFTMKALVAKDLKEEQHSCDASTRSCTETMTTVASMDVTNRSRADTGNSWSSSIFATSDADNESIWGGSVSQPIDQEWSVHSSNLASITSREDTHHPFDISSAGGMSGSTGNPTFESVAEGSATYTIPLVRPIDSSHTFDLTDTSSWLDSGDNRGRGNLSTLLPSKLLSESFSDHEDETPTNISSHRLWKREESSHPIFDEEWLDQEVLNNKEETRRSHWFGRKNTRNSATAETASQKPIKRDSSAHSDEEWMESPPGPSSSFSLFGRWKQGC